MNSSDPTSYRSLKHCLSPGLPYLLPNTMCDSLRRWNFRSSWKAFLDKTSTAAYFFTIKALQRKKRRAQTLESYPHESLAGLFFFSFFILPPTACLILIKPIRHSCLFVFHWIGWRYLIHSLTLRNKLKSFFESSCISSIQLKGIFFFNTREK